jgi:hypothetical protein
LSNTSPQQQFQHQEWCRKCHPKLGAAPARLHHSWCPQGPFYGDNGAIGILQRIQHGLSVQCEACHQEFRAGKLLPNAPHNAACVQHQAIVKRQKQQQVLEQQRLEQERALQAQVQAKKLLEAKQKRKRQEEKARKALEKKRAEEMQRARKMQEESSEDELSEEEDYRPRKRSKAVSKAARVTPSAQERGELEVKWVKFDGNPWGPSGHSIGDIMLFGPPVGPGHHDVNAPSPRYNPFPFAENSRYRTTHRTPEEGLTVLILERDPMATHPWGFHLVRDEFGQGCIVNRVDALSPATTGVSEPLRKDILCGL